MTHWRRYQNNANISVTELWGWLWTRLSWLRLRTGGELFRKGLRASRKAGNCVTLVSQAELCYLEIITQVMFVLTTVTVALRVDYLVAVPFYLRSCRPDPAVKAETTSKTAQMLCMLNSVRRQVELTFHPFCLGLIRYVHQ